MFQCTGEREDEERKEKKTIMYSFSLGLNFTHNRCKTMKYLRNRQGEKVCSLRKKPRQTRFLLMGAHLQIVYIHVHLVRTFLVYQRTTLCSLHIWGVLVKPYLLVVTVEVRLCLTSAPLQLQMGEPPKRSPGLSICRNVQKWKISTFTSTHWIKTWNQQSQIVYIAS